MTNDTQEQYDDDLRWRLETLKLMFEEGKIHIADHLWEDTKTSLSKVQYQPDGKIDLSTVDGRVRSMSLMAAHMHQRNQAKDAISLSDISSMYFEFIEKNLGFINQEAKNYNLDALEFARLAPKSSDFVRDIVPQIPKFIETMQEFWENVSDSAHYHIQDLRASKAIYGGDLFPSYQRNISSTASLYIDTIILSDPFWNSRHIFNVAKPETQLHYLVKHTINVLQYQKLANANTDVPIVAFAPFRSSVDEQEAEFLKRIATADGLKHASRIFGREFTEADELWEFVAPLENPEQIVASIADASRVLFDTEWTESLEEQLSKSLKLDWSSTLEAAPHAGQMLAAQCFGRMGQATDLLLKSRYLAGVPLMDAPTSWQYFNWKLEYNSAIEPDSRTHLHMIRGLQRASDTDEEWLGNIPPDAIIEMRKSGAFDEIRSVLSVGVDELSQANPTNFFRSSDKIVENIRDAFERHMKEVKDLRAKKVKFAGHDIGTMVAAGAIDIASIVTGTPTFGAASFAVNQLIDAPKLREIPNRFRELNEAHKELKKSPMGLFFEHKARK
ncbi:hypothetical protein [Yoonia sp. TsM2_T14_4]|uniref:hypothetical protein n=1 Tax=Yoonia sp. TsM2_T14_4 TaxID=3415141 RepID=UPI003C77D579